MSINHVYFLFSIESIRCKWREIKKKKKCCISKEERFPSGPIFYDGSNCQWIYKFHLNSACESRSIPKIHWIPYTMYIFTYQFPSLLVNHRLAKHENQPISILKREKKSPQKIVRRHIVHETNVEQTIQKLTWRLWE